MSTIFGFFNIVTCDEKIIIFEFVFFYYLFINIILIAFFVKV